MKLSDEQIREFIAGCEGVTPGPWELAHSNGIFPAGDRAHSVATATLHRKETVDNAAHISRCDPDTIRTLCEEVLRLRERTDRLCLSCGRSFPAEQGRTESPAGCRSPEACTIDMTHEEAFMHWSKKAHDLMVENDRLWRDYHVAVAAVPMVFLLDPPDGGDVKLHEGIARMADENARLRVALKPFAAPIADFVPDEATAALQWNARGKVNVLGGTFWRAEDFRRARAALEGSGV